MCHPVKEGVGLGSAHYTIAGEKLLEGGWFYFKNCINETSIANFCHLSNTKNGNMIVFLKLKLMQTVNKDVQLNSATCRFLRFCHKHIQK